MAGKLKTYYVWLSQHSKVKVRAFSKKGARQQAWKGLTDKYGWTRADFLKNATTTEVV